MLSIFSEQEQIKYSTTVITYSIKY